MLRKKTKTEIEPKEEEKVIDAEVVDEKPVETKIVKIVPDHKELMSFAMVCAKSGMFPSISNEFEAACVIEYGRELGIDPIFALQTIAPVKGKLSIESKVLYALALKDGIKVKFLQKDSMGCVLEFSKEGRDPYTCSFTAEDAKRAGLSGKTSFMNYPEEMYFNRCLSKGLRAFDPRIFLGLTTREEAEDFGDSPLAKAPTPEEPEKQEKKKKKLRITKTKDQPEPEPEPIPEPEPEPEPEKPKKELETSDEIKQKEIVVSNIKQYLKESFVDERVFKKWLGEEFIGRKPDLEFVGLKYGNWSFTEGKLDDLKKLEPNMEWAVSEYFESETFKKEGGKEKPEEKKKEEPL